MTPAESAVLSAAYAYAAADRAEIEARHAHQLKQRTSNPRDPNFKQVLADLYADLLTAEDATREARSAMHRIVRRLELEESKFDVVGAP